MKIDFVKANTKRYLDLAEEIYMEAFPAVERKPFSMLVDAQTKGNVEILMIRHRKEGDRPEGRGCREAKEEPEASGAHKDGEVLDRTTRKDVPGQALVAQDKESVLGEIILARYADVVLLDYFAVAAAFRGHGIGAQALGELQKRCRGERLVLEIESTKVDADNLGQRCSRKAFYERCGMRTLDYSVMVMGVEMEVLTFGCEVGFGEYHAVYEGVFGAQVGERVWLAG